MGNNTNKWTKSQVNFLRRNYHNLTAKELSIPLNRSVSAIRIKAMELKINCKNYHKWTSEEIGLLKTKYPICTKNELSKIFKPIVWENIKSQANKLGLKRNQRNKELILGHCENLLQNTSEAFYWMGFLLADGHFSKENRMAVTLSKLDTIHLKKFCKFLKYKSMRRPGKHGAVSMSILDTYNVGLIKEKFNISNIKTYNPPDISKYSFDLNLLICLICGFIDGDGSIGYQTGRKDATLRIKCHASWLEFIIWIKKKFKEKFLIDSGNPKINNSGYAGITFANHKLLKELKKFTQNFNLPVLERKWNKIS